MPPIPVASATYTLERLTRGTTDADRVVASGAAVVDALSEPLAAPSGRGTTSPRRLNIAASAAVRGRTYAVVEDGDSELLRVEGVSGAAVIASAPLSAAYTALATLRGVEVRAVFPAAAAAIEELQEDDEPLRVTWQYTIDGRLVRVPEQVRVRLQASDQGYLGRVEQAIREEWPELVQLLPKDPNALRTLVRGCSDWIVARYRGRLIKPEEFMAGDQGYQALLQRCVWRFGERGHVPRGKDPDNWEEQQRANFLTTWRTVSVGSPGTDTAESDRRTDTAPAGRAKKTRGFIRPM